MQKEILINIESLEKRVAVVESNILQEYYVERPSEKTLVGNIYKGTVKTIVSGINAAFVDIGFSKHGYLNVTDILMPSQDFDLLDDEGEDSNRRPSRPKHYDIHKLVKEGQEIFVQVGKEPIGNKGPRLTTHIGIPGRFIVFMPLDRHLGVSKKIRDREERGRLHKILKKIAPPFKAGIIVRTAGIGKSEKDFRREAKQLSGLWNTIKRNASRVKPPSVLHEEFGLTFRILRDIFNDDINRILIDDRQEYKRLRNFANSIMPVIIRKLMLYKERKHLFESRGIEKDIENLCKKRVGLKCKGYIVIEETEGLIAIDVNSGSFSRRRMEDTAFKVNCEAAEEIARQIRLRDIGGIVVIDFIDMREERHGREIFNILLRSFKRDKAKISILRMSEFGIVEMTRQRIRRGVKKVSYQNCPYCSGRGSVKSVTTMSIEILRVVKKELEKGRLKEIRVYVHPEVANYLLNEDRPNISRIESEHRTRIIIIAEPNLHIENFRLHR